MKKLLPIIMCLSMVVCFSACGNSDSSTQNYKSYEVGDYTVELPEAYEYNDLKEVKAEPDCIAMLDDEDGELPMLWIYEDKCEGSSIKDHIKSIDSFWNFNELSIYKKDDAYLAKTTFDEDWYGEKHINEAFYRTEGGNKILTFDFSYLETDDPEAMHQAILEISESLGF